MFGMKAYLINMHLLVPRSRSSAKVKVKYKGYITQKMAVSGAFVFYKHILFTVWQRVKSMDGFLTFSSIYTHFNILKKKAQGKHCGKR